MIQGKGLSFCAIVGISGAARLGWLTTASERPISGCKPTFPQCAIPGRRRRKRYLLSLLSAPLPTQQQLPRPSHSFAYFTVGKVPGHIRAADFNGESLVLQLTP